MARKILTTVDDILAAIEFDLMIEGKLADPKSICGDDASSEQVYQKYPMCRDNVKPFESHEEIDMQAARDSFDPTSYRGSLIENPTLNRQVEEFVNSELTKAGVLPDIIKRISSLNEKVACLYKLQHPPPLKSSESPEPTFAIQIVSPLYGDGIIELRGQHITYDTEWHEFSQALQSAITIFEIGQQENRLGYTAKDGPWFYKVHQDSSMSIDSSIKNKEWEKLASEQDYRNMKTTLFERGNDPNITVVLRHVSFPLSS